MSKDALQIPYKQVVIFGPDYNGVLKRDLGVAKTLIELTFA